MGAVGSNTGRAPTAPVLQLDPEDFLESVASKVAAKIGAPKPTSSGRVFLGMDTGAWTRLIVGWLVAVVLAGGAWWLSVRDGLAARPTFKEAATGAQDAIQAHEHSTEAHPPIQQRLDAMEREQTLIRESQIRQEETDKAQTKVLEEIKVEVGRIRRGR